MATIAGGSGTAAGGVTEKVTECLIRGVVEKNILNELIPVLQSYSSPHLKCHYFMTKDDEYYTTLTRMTILKRDDYFMEIENISEDIFTENQRYQEKIQQIQPICYLYQEGRSLIGDAIVRSRRQSFVVGNIEKFLGKFDAIIRKSWHYFGFQIELLGGIKVSILQSIQEDKTSNPHPSVPFCYIIEIKCSSSESNINLASEKVTNMATTLSPFIHLSES